MVVWKFLLLTLVVELPIVAIWLHYEWKRAIDIGFWLNLFTWPLLVVIVTNLHWNVLVMECIVAIVEGIGYYLFFRRNLIVCMFLSFLVNGLSYGIGLLI